MRLSYSDTKIMSKDEGALWILLLCETTVERNGFL